MKLSMARKMSLAVKDHQLLSLLYQFPPYPSIAASNICRLLRRAVPGKEQDHDQWRMGKHKTKENL